MSNADRTTMVPGTAPSTPAVQVARVRQRIALAGMAFGSEGGEAGVTGVFHTQARHLAFLPAETLELDLLDPAERAFGDYELVEKIGQGGMGVVYRARQTSLDREVAIKLLSAGPWASPEFIERFKREAQSAARMQHPNIVSIFEIGTHAELNYFSMQLVRGPSLAQVLAAKGPMAARDAARLLRTIAEAVDYAHRLGVLHLDLKPGNVLVDERGEPQVADFGLARRLDETLATEGEEISGTPSYMAPEQAQLRSHKLSPATDIYGLGAILYELLTGKPPFLGPSAQETLKRVVSEPPERPRSHCRSIPADLEAICLKCLEKSPKDRYAGARQLADDLGRFVDGRLVSARTPDPIERGIRWARREPRVAAIASLLVASVVVGLTATTLQWRTAQRNASNARNQQLQALENSWDAKRQQSWNQLTAFNWTRSAQILIDNIAERERFRPMEARTESETIERTMLGHLFDRNPSPLGEYSTEAYAIASAFSNDGRHLAYGTVLGHIAVIDLSTGKKVWVRTMPKSLTTNRIAQDWQQGWTGATQEQPSAKTLRYSSDAQRIIVTLQQPSYNFQHGLQNDMVAYSASTGEMLWPRQLARQQTSLLINANATTAILRTGDRTLQVTRISDTNPLGAPWKLPDTWIPNAITHQGDILSLFTAARDRTQFRYTIDGTLIHALTLQHETIVSMSASPMTNQFAIGTSSGAILLVDPELRLARRYEQPTRSIATNAQFSDDGQWIIAGDNVGNTLLEPTHRQNGRPYKLPSLNLPDQVNIIHMGIDAKALATESVEGINLWTRPVRSSSMVLSSAGAVNSEYFSSSAIHVEQRLLATAAPGKAIRLYRIPLPSARDQRGLPLGPGRLTFDGTHVHAVRDSAVEIVDMSTGLPVSHRFNHDRPIHIASLSPDGNSLLTASGNVVRLIGWRQNVPDIKAYETANTPSYAGFSPSGRFIFIADESLANRSLVSTLHSVDLRHPNARPHSAQLQSVLSGLRADASDGTVTVWTEDGELSVLLASTLERRLRIPQVAPGHRIYDALLTADGSRVIACDSNQWSDGTLRHIDANSGILMHSTDVLRGCERIEELPDGAVLASTEAYRVLVVRRDGSQVHGPIEYSSEGHSTGDIAVSPDFSRAAFATQTGVVLIKTSGLDRILPELKMGSVDEPIARIAFSPDGSQLLAQSASGVWGHWNIAPVAGDALDLQTQLDSARIVFDDRPRTLPVPPPVTVLVPSTAEPVDYDLPSLDGSNTRMDAALDLSSLSVAQSRLLDASYGPEFLSDIPNGRQRLLGVDFNISAGIIIGGPFVDVPETSASQQALGHVELDVGRSVATLSILALLFGQREMRGNDWIDPHGSCITATLVYTDGQQSSSSFECATLASSSDASRERSVTTAWTVRDEIDLKYTMRESNRIRYPVGLLTMVNPEPGKVVRSLKLRAGQLDPLRIRIAAVSVR